MKMWIVYGDQLVRVSQEVRAETKEQAIEIALSQKHSWETDARDPVDVVGAELEEDALARCP